MLVAIGLGKSLGELLVRQRVPSVAPAVSVHSSLLFDRYRDRTASVSESLGRPRDVEDRSIARLDVGRYRDRAAVYVHSLTSVW